MYSCLDGRPIPREEELDHLFYSSRKKQARQDVINRIGNIIKMDEMHSDAVKELLGKELHDFFLYEAYSTDES